MAARLGTRRGVLQKDVPHATAEVPLVVGGSRHAAARDGGRVPGGGVGRTDGQCRPNAGT